MVTQLKEKIDLLKIVYNNGGIVSLGFRKKKGGRAKMPEVSDYRIKGFRFGSDSVHVLVSPANTLPRAQERIFSIDGRTSLSSIQCGDKVISF